MSEPSGPKMDAWCAEFVLGIELPLHNPAGRILEYSTADGMTTGATWRIVEAMEKREGMLHLSHITAGENMWECRFQNWRGLYVQNATGETPPLAICRAALLAVIGG